MQLLKIRYYQLKRDLGILFFLILALLLGVSYFTFNHPKQIGFYAVGIIFYAFYSFHQKRNDKPFILKHFNNPIQQIVIEYQLFLLPLSLPCLLSSYWYCFFLLHLMVLIIPYLKSQTKIQLKLIAVTTYFKNDYIFITGIRKNFIPLVLFLILAVLFSPLKLFSLVALFLFNSTLFSFYDTNECVQLLQASKQSPSYFLFSKFNSAVIKLLIINVPTLVINTAFNFDMLWFNLFFLAYNVLILFAIICIKYESYHYNKTGNGNQIKLIIFLFGMFNLYIAAISVALCLQARQGAIKNLSNYLDDNN